MTCRVWRAEKDIYIYIEREREKKGVHSMYALENNDARSVTVNKVDLDSENMLGSCGYDGKTSVTFRSNIT